MSEYEIGKDIQDLRRRVEALERGSAEKTATSTRWWHDDPDAHRQGFGIVLHLKGEQWVVHRTLAGSPAEAAGVQNRDILHAIGGKAMERSIRGTKLTAVIELLDGDSNHEIVFLRGQEQVVKPMRPRVLREVLDVDANQSGSARGYCYSCPYCYSRLKGVSNCPGDCPGLNCIVT